VLLVTPFAPAGAGRHGAGRAIHGLASAMARRHDLVLLHLEQEHDVDAELAALCVDVIAHPVRAAGTWKRRVQGTAAFLRGRSLWSGGIEIPHLQRRVRALSESVRPDVVQVEHAVIGDALAAAPEALRVITIHDPAAHLRDSLPLHREGLGLAHRVDALASARQERRVLSLADAAVVFTEHDRQTLARKRPASTEIVTIPLGWDVPPAPLDPVGGDPPTLLFVGAYRHPPNLGAALTLAQDILPLVQQTHPGVTLDIVGESPPPELKALASASVRVTGDVPSVMPYLDRAAVVVAPIAIGGGMRVKVLEALAAGKAVVASSRAVQGLTARDGEHLVVADGHVETAAAIVDLIEHVEARRRLGEAARAWALRELTWSAMADRYDELYGRLAARRDSRSADRILGVAAER
jgi:glycosyltransferase involved in cell wall biosynthesis